MRKDEVRSSIVRRCCEHVSLRDVEDRASRAERLVDGVMAEYRGLPNWRVVLRLVERVAVDACQSELCADAIGHCNDRLREPRRTPNEQRELDAQLQGKGSAIDEAH